MSLRWTSLRRFSQYRGPGPKQNVVGSIRKLVPRTGSVNLIDEEGKVQKTDLRSIRLSPLQTLKILNIQPTEEGKDPNVAVKVISQESAQVSAKSGGDKKAKAPKKASVKDVIVSWQISKNDLEGPKQTAIESVLGRGHSLQLKLEAKRKSTYYRDLSQEELEARDVLLTQLRAILDKYGEQQRPPEGSIKSRLTLFYRPKPKES